MDKVELRAEASNMISSARIAIAGAGIYGSTIAVKLSRCGHAVTLYDPLGIMCGASVINQCRIHSGYHYPRSPETIAEILEARSTFVNEYQDAIVQGCQNYYAIPFEGSRTNPDAFEKICQSYALPLTLVRPNWINFRFVAKCYRVVEDLYEPEILKLLIKEKLKLSRVHFKRERFSHEDEKNFDFVVYATYGASGSHMYLFERIKIQVAEKIIVRLPNELVKKSLVVIDGPFTGFDPYGNSEYSQFGSAVHTNHWTTSCPRKPIPDRYNAILNAKKFRPFEFTHFEKMVHDAVLSVPLVSRAEYLGSRFTLRLVEDNPTSDRRILRIHQADAKTFHVFSGKVVSAVKAADIIERAIANV